MNSNGWIPILPPTLSFSLFLENQPWNEGPTLPRLYTIPCCSPGTDSSVPKKGGRTHKLNIYSKPPTLHSRIKRHPHQRIQRSVPQQWHPYLVKFITMQRVAQISGCLLCWYEPTLHSRLHSLTDYSLIGILFIFSTTNCTQRRTLLGNILSRRATQKLPAVEKYW